MCILIEMASCSIIRIYKRSTITISIFLLRDKNEFNYQRVAEKIFFFDFIVLNERSIQTIVKSKILDHLVVIPMKNASKNKFKGYILTLKI
jgi:hypothetical protein